MTQIVAFDRERHTKQVVDLWREAFGYETAHNEPRLVIEKKLAANDGLFWVAVNEDLVVGTVMAGYDGHRGWIYSLAVGPSHRRQGIGSLLLSHAEGRLVTLGCLKINLQIADGNEHVQGFYQANGYAVEKRISMGKRI